MIETARPYGLPCANDRSGNDRTGAAPQRGFDYPSPDGYTMFLEMGTLPNIDEKMLKGSVPFWNDFRNHPLYDEFWQARDVRRHLKGIRPAVLTVGGWFDAEDLFGTLSTFRAVEAGGPGSFNGLVMGPWFHGGWAKSDGSRLGNVQFGKGVNDYYYNNIELRFFNTYLKGEVNIMALPEANIFVTGENKWTTFKEWPPKNTETKSVYLNEKESLSFNKPTHAAASFSEYVSNPAKPVPYTEDVHLKRTREYMSDDQRFASRRPDVLTFKTDVLMDEVTLTGPVIADLLVSISTTDADFVVKLIDVFPDTFSYSGKDKYPMGGYQMLVRGEVMRGKFRNSFEKPEAFTPEKITQVKFELPDVAHTFQKGHRIMIQIQSSWFPLVDRNPQQFVDIYHCNDSDFKTADIRIYHQTMDASSIILPVLKK